MNDRPTLAELRGLAAIAAHRSFRKAAEELGMAPSSLSHLLTGLEARMGTRLLHRTTRSVSATGAGERLVARLRPILRELDVALAEAEEGSDRPRGLLRITASDPVSLLLMQGVVPEFLRLHPEMALDLVAQPAFVDIVAEGFDAGIRLGEDVPRDMVAVRLGGPSRMLAVASPDYLDEHGVPGTPDELTRHRCIRSRTPTGRPYRWEFERHGQALAVEVTGPLTLNRSDLMMEAALRGIGIAFVPERIAAPFLRDGRLRVVLEEWSPSYPGLFLFYPGHRHVPAGLRAFVEVLRAVPP